jgi:hypothetical protein
MRALDSTRIAAPAVALHGLVALALACQKIEAPQEGTLRPLPPPPGAATPAALPDPERAGGHVGRAPRRLTVAQLRESIRVTTGREWRGLTGVAASLGQADFAFINAESTEANLVFAKFLEDGAREVCRDTAQADLKLPKAADRVLARELPDNVMGKIDGVDDATIKRHLEYLSTRFWGQPLAGQELDRWVASWKGFAARAEAIKLRDQALSATCVALMTDPRFITY